MYFKLDPRTWNISISTIDRSKVIDNASSKEIMNSRELERRSKRSKFQKSSNTSDKNFELDKSNTTTVAGTALDNFVIMKEIFGYLSPVDLRSCCQVNQTWLSIADPMIVDYKLIWKNLRQIEVKITTGFVDSQIEPRMSTIAAEMEFIENQRRAPFVDMLFDVSKMKDYSSSKNLVIDCREFLSRIGSKVYKLTCVGDHCAQQFFSSVFNNDYATQKATICHGRYFPYVEDLRLLPQGTNQLVWPNSSTWWHNLSLPNVRQFYTGDSPYWNRKYHTASKILDLMPNVRELHGVAYTFVPELRDLDKLHLLRSVGFNKHFRGFQGYEAVRCLVEAKLNLQFMVIGRKLPFKGEKAFIKSYRKNLKVLLQHGREQETLEHLMVRALRPGRIVELPCEMPTVKHITFRGSGFCVGNSYFKKGEDLLKIFPNVDTITFQDFTSCKWKLTDSWWLEDGMFYSEDVRKGIRFLQSNQKLELNVEQKLLKSFLNVKNIEMITVDLYGDDTVADAIIAI